MINRRRRAPFLVVLGAVMLAAAGAWWQASEPGPGTHRRAAATATPAALPSSTRPAVEPDVRPRRRRLRLRRSRVAVPILMYHVIAAPYPGAPYPGLYVPLTEFRAQMHALARAGYRAVTMDTVRRAWLGRARLPRRPIVLTFDNGYRTQYTHALPVLRRLGWVGVENLQLRGLPQSVGGLRATEVRRLVAAGWELDTQGQTHADLVDLNPAELRYQIASARRQIRRRFHVRADWFCYPSGDYDAAVIAAVRAAGFVGSTTVVPGWARPGDDPYRLPRIRVLGGTGPRELLDEIARTRRTSPPPASYPPSP